MGAKNISTLLLWMVNSGKLFTSSKQQFVYDNRRKVDDGYTIKRYHLVNINHSADIQNTFTIV